MARIHFVVKEPDKARYQNQARREQNSLGAWLREAAEEKLRAATRSGRFTLDDLKRFNVECDAREKGNQEPDWTEHKQTISESKVRGLDMP